MTAPTVENVVTAFMKLRQERDTIKRDADNKMAALNEKMAAMESWLLEKMEKEGVSSYKTKNGTAFKTTTDFANVADWDALLQHVLTTEDFHLLERRVNKMAVRSFIDEGKPPPPGVNYGTKIDINIRRPTAS